MLIHIPIQLDLKVHTESGFCVDAILEQIEQMISDGLDTSADKKLILLKEWILANHGDDTQPQVTVSQSVTTSQGGE